MLNYVDIYTLWVADDYTRKYKLQQAYELV